MKTISYVLASIVCGLALAAAPDVRGAEGDVLYENDFDQGGTAPTGWTATTYAEYSDCSVKPGKSLKLTTWISADNKVQLDAKDCVWSGPLLAVPTGKVFRISAWVHNNILYSQDQTYCADMGVIWYDAAGKELGSSEGLSVSAKPKADIAADDMPVGQNWVYCEGIAQPRPNAVSMRPVLAWSSYFAPGRPVKNVRGEFYLDHLRIKAETPVLSDGRVAGTSSPEGPAPWNLTMAAPGGLFHVSEPLSFGVTVKAKELGLTKEDRLRWAVTDFTRRELARGEQAVETFTTNKANWISTPLVLPDSVKQGRTGQWLALRVEVVTPQGKVVAHPEIVFSITDPYVPKSVHEATTSRFIYKGNFGKAYVMGDGLEKWSMLQRWGHFDIFECGLNNISEYPNKEPVPFEKREAKCCIIHPPHLGSTPSAEAVAAYAKTVEDIVRVYPATHFLVTAKEGNDALSQNAIVEAALIAVKKVDPRIKAGATVYFYTTPPAKILRAPWIDRADFLVVDSYSTDPKTYEPGQAVRDALAQAGKKIELWNMESGYNAYASQVDHARGDVLGIVNQLAHGTDKCFWLLQCSASAKRNIRDARYGGGSAISQFAFYGHINLEIEGAYNADSDLKRTAWYGSALFPKLEAMSVYNVRDLLAYADFRSMKRIGADGRVYLFDRRVDGKSVVVLGNFGSSDPRTLWLNTGGVGAEVIDLYGNRVRLTPVRNRVALSVGKDPLLLICDSRLAELSVEDCSLEVVAREGAFVPGAEVVADYRIGLPADRSDLSVSVDMLPEWGGAKPVVEGMAGLGSGEVLKAARPVCLPSDFAGTEAYTPVKLLSGKAVCGYLAMYLPVTGKTGLAVSTQPATAKAKATIIIKVTNRDVREHTYTVRASHQVTDAFEPTPFGGTLKVASGAQGELVVELEKQPDPNRDYSVSCEVLDESGRVEASVIKDMGFRGVPRLAKAPVIDGDPGDWPLARMTSYVSQRGINDGGGYGYAQKRAKAARIRTYLGWDEKKLYALIMIENDPELVTLAPNQPKYWWHDCLIVRLFAGAESTEKKPVWGYHFYRDSEGNGKCVCPGSDMWPEETVIKDVNGVRVIEVAWTPVLPNLMALAPGSRFRMMACYFDSGRGGSNWFRGCAGDTSAEFASMMLSEETVSADAPARQP